MSPQESAPQATPKSERPNYQFPLGEPAYTSKIPRDLSAFTAELDGFSAERAAELDAVLTTATIPDMQELMTTRKLTSVELVTYYVDRIRRYDIGKLNAIMTLNPQALATAAVLDDERANGLMRGPLHGIPVLLKDNIATADMPTTAGVFALRNWQPDHDAFLTARLREAGAIVLGKTNLSEFANYTDPNTPNGFSTLGGQTQNPHGPFDPLGSSSGSAVAAAANFAAVTVGTETQGSVIMPAIVNGVFGLKTSRGIVSRDGIIPLMEAQDVPGPMGRNATDLAVMMTVMAGPDPNDPATHAALEIVGTDFLSYLTAEAIGKLRVGVAGDPAKASSPEGELAASVMGALGEADIEAMYVDANEVDNIPGTNLVAVLPHGFRRDLDAFLSALGENAPVGSLAEVAATNAEDPANRCPYGQRSITGAVDDALSEEDYETAVSHNQAVTSTAINKILDRYNIDVLFFPQGQQYAAAGFPAISIPVGLQADGQPVGLVFIAGFMGDGHLLTLARALEQKELVRPIPDLDTTIAALP